MKRWIAAGLAFSMFFSLAACTPAGTGRGTTAAPSESGGQTELMNAVQYPTAAGFEDYEALRKNREENDVDAGFLSALDAFAFRTASAVLGKAEGNANYSPLSLYLALSLAASGAAGDTQKQMLSLLGGAEASALSDQCARLYRLLYTDNEIGKLHIANSLWLDNEVQGAPVRFREAFLQTAAESFYAAAYRTDFSDKAAGRAMAQWVSENTNGALTPEFPTDPEQILSILNTVYFYDEWTDAFDGGQTKAGAFHAAGGDVTADFMNRTAAAGFARGENFTRAWLGLKNQGQMAFILPDEGVNASELIASADAVRTLFQGGTESYGEVVWSVPKFRYGCRYELADTLKALGMDAAFDPDSADFSGITDTPAWLSKVAQQTHIAIDEKGVEAAAFTELGFAGMGLPQDRAEMILDRPFVYGILAPNGTLLFAGVCADPSAVS